MSKFVNYGKRNVTLPNGWKALVDCQQDQEMPEGLSMAASHALEDIDGEYATTPLSQISRYIAMALESPSVAFMLVMASLDDQFTFGVVKMEDAVQASAIVRNDACEKGTMRGLFARHHLAASSASGMAGVFKSDLSRHDIYNISPIPADASGLSKLVANLFRDFSGLKRGGKVRVRYTDFAEPA